jgi:hypothetical protein
MSFIARWRQRRSCFHHDHAAGVSWLESRLINMGAGKMFWCSECQKTWTV